MMQSSNDAQMAAILKGLARCLTDYLTETLPHMRPETWWNDLVLPRLSYQQAQRVRQRGVCDLKSLDLAALLRVLDENWYDISNKMSLPGEGRHYLKELHSVRNRWAHVSAGDDLTGYVYRDIDTVQRLVNILAPDDAFGAELETLKHQAMHPKATTAVRATQTEHALPAPADPAATPEPVGVFKPGDLVTLRSDSAQTLAILTRLPSRPEDRYEVLHNGIRQFFYASQLHPVSGQPDRDAECVSAERFQAALTAVQIVHPGASSLFSLNAARIDFIPYQFRPVIKFIRSDCPRLLIADSVGVGKTIEAGLILRELAARSPLESVLIICPKPLVAERKWESEMKRFSERFEHLDSLGLQRLIDDCHEQGDLDPKKSRVIVPYSILDSKLYEGENGRFKRIGLKDLDPPPSFDLVIVDEAHHIRNTATCRHKAVSFFCKNAKAVLFLTATPLQLGTDDLFVLLNTLRPDWVPDKATFNAMAEANPYINHAVNAVRGAAGDWRPKAISALEKAKATPWGRAVFDADPNYRKSAQVLQAGSCTDHERVGLITSLEALHTFSPIINRTRRRDIGAFTIRKSQSVVVEFTAQQRALYDRLLVFQQRLFALRHDPRTLGFLMSTIKRQAASCIFGLVPCIERILTRGLDPVDDGEDESVQLSLDPAFSDALRNEAKGLIREAGELPWDDPKFDELLKIIMTKQASANPRLMVFSSFLHTLDYLEHRLRTAGLRVALIHGETPDEERRLLRKRFMLAVDDPQAIHVMLFSEVGCEGLDYQFCDCLVNYDLPWNPMKIEQRIGRIDRNGQKSESVLICNIITGGTIDAIIFDRCLNRIKIFEESIGECEAILGELTRAIFATAMDPKLTEEQQKAKIQQLADNLIRQQQELEVVDQQSKGFFGLDLSQERFQDDIEASSTYWLGARAMENLLAVYLRILVASDTAPLQGAGPVKTLRLSRSLRETLLQQVEDVSSPRVKTQASRDWRNRLRKDEQYIRVAFDSASAADDPGVELLSPLHPLIRQAAFAVSDSKRIIASLLTSHPDVPAGIHPYAIYIWNYKGIREETRLTPVCMNEALQPILNEALEQAVSYAPAPDERPDGSIPVSLEQRHRPLWEQALKRHVAETRELAEYRLRSLATSREAQARILQERIVNQSDEDIRRMHQSELTKVIGRYENREKELHAAIDRADIHQQLIAWGFMKGVYREL